MNLSSTTNRQSLDTRAAYSSAFRTKRPNYSPKTKRLETNHFHSKHATYVTRLVRVSDWRGCRGLLVLVRNTAGVRELG